VQMLRGSVLVCCLRLHVCVCGTGLLGTPAFCCWDCSVLTNVLFCRTPASLQLSFAASTSSRSAHTSSCATI